MLVALIAAAATVAGGCRDRAAELRRIIVEVHTKQRNVGLQAAIRREGSLEFSEGFGLADLEHGVAVDPRTRFTVASITKAITGLALLRAMERGVSESWMSAQSRSDQVRPRGDVRRSLSAAT